MPLTQPQLDLLYSQLTRAKSTSVDGTSVTNRSAEEILAILKFDAGQVASEQKKSPVRYQFYRAPGMTWRS